jgi:hypothetical protein
MVVDKLDTPGACARPTSLQLVAGVRLELKTFGLCASSNSETKIQQVLDVALLSSRTNFQFLLLNCTEAVSSFYAPTALEAHSRR